MEQAMLQVTYGVVSVFAFVVLVGAFKVLHPNGH
jgi:hypothetical protein